MCPSYRAIDGNDPPPGNPIDMTVHRRIGSAKVQRALSRPAQAVIDALGRRCLAWLAYKDVLARVAGRLQPAYFDLDVEHGIAAARANQLPVASKSARAVAEHLVREVLGTGVAPRVRVEAALLAAWGVVATRRSKRPASIT